MCQKYAVIVVHFKDSTQCESGQMIQQLKKK